MFGCVIHALVCACVRAPLARSPPPVCGSQRHEGTAAVDSRASKKKQKKKKKSKKGAKLAGELDALGASAAASLKFAGFLAKKGGGTSAFGRRNWLRRWFTLDDRFLRYRVVDGGKVLGTIDVATLASVEKRKLCVCECVCVCRNPVVCFPWVGTTKDRSNHFEVTLSTPRRTFFLVAPSAEERDRFVAAVEACLVSFQ